MCTLTCTTNAAALQAFQQEKDLSREARGGAGAGEQVQGSDRRLGQRSAAR